MSDEADIEAGKAAWGRLRNDRLGFDAWVAVGRALAIGKAMALLAAKTNRPVGSKYNRLMGAWLAANDLDGIGGQERYRAILIVENLPAILAWRDGLDDRRRRHMNHPNTIIRTWKSEMTAKKPPDSRRQVCHSRPSTKFAEGKYHHTIKFDQDMIRRAGLKMRENFSNDVYALARICLSAAIRDERDILELLPDLPKPAPRQSAAPVALELT